MFNILIVDDDEPTLEQMSKMIQDEIPEARIDTAATVKDGNRCVQQAREREQPYHAVILDFRLPLTQGENDEVDESVCANVETVMPDALVIHITAFREDPHIIRHLSEFHQGSKFGNRAIRLWKLDDGMPDELMANLKPELYGRHVLDRLNKFFNLEARNSSGRRRQRYPGGIRTGKSRTHELGAVTREIAEYWPSLDYKVRQRVKSIFSVKETGSAITVSLFRSPSKPSGDSSARGLED